MVAMSEIEIREILSCLGPGFIEGMPFSERDLKAT